MQNPLKDMSRPKALGLAGMAAGVLAISGGAAAMNVGLISSGASEPFTPEPVSVTEEQPTTTTTASDPVIAYEDVYETVPAVAPSAPTPAVASSDDDSDDAVSSDDDSDDSDDQGEYEDSDDQGEYEDSDDGDSEDEDHADEDHEDEDDGEDD